MGIGKSKCGEGAGEEFEERQRQLAAGHAVPSLSEPDEMYFPMRFKSSSEDVRCAP